MTLSLLCLSLLACSKDASDDDGGTDTGTGLVDADGDGFDVSVDCDDGNADIHPDAEEVCDGIDNDCDDEVDGPDATDASTWYTDSDGDGFGDISQAIQACEAPSDAVADNSDCDDTSDEVYPGADEICNDVDDDCDDEVDEDAIDKTAWYSDGDGDGYGDPTTEVWSCEAIAGKVDNGDDCKDWDEEINPGAAEICDGIDNDCDEGSSEDGTVTLMTEAGITDVTSQLTGTSTAPAAYSLDEGVLNFCNGTHYVNLELKGNSGLRSQNQDPTLAILDGGGMSWVVHNEDSKKRVTIEDLMIQGGEGASDSLLGVPVGGGIYCAAASGTSWSTQEMTLDNVILSANNADYGGGLFSVFCDLDIKNVEISNNTAGVGAGFYLLQGKHQFTNSDILDNVADSVAGGGVIIGQSLSTSNVSGAMNEVVVNGNSASDEVGGIAFVGGSFAWSGSQGSGGSGIHGNAVTYDGAGFYLKEAVFKSKGIDLGTLAGGDDNESVDVVYMTDDGPIQYWAGDDSGFACNSSGCGTPDLETLGGTTTDATIDEKALVGNLVESTTTATLNDWELDFSGTDEQGCDVDFYLLGTATQPGTGSTTWDIEWSNQNVSVESTGVTSSGNVGIALEDGRFYALTTWSRCELDAGLDLGTGSTTAGFGTGLAFVAALDLSQGNLSGSTVVTTEYESSYGTPLGLDLHFTEL
jgi:hypothetical protein